MARIVPCLWHARYRSASGGDELRRLECRRPRFERSQARGLRTLVKPRDNARRDPAVHLYAIRTARRPAARVVRTCILKIWHDVDLPVVLWFSARRAW